MALIHKIALPLKQNEYGNYQTNVPREWIPLSTALQNGSICIWYQFNEEEKRTETVEIMTIPTGEVFDDTEMIFHIGTVLWGAFVWHIAYKNIVEHDI